MIEPSFGIGRIIYAIWEHNFVSRDGDAQRTVREKFYFSNIKILILIKIFLCFKFLSLPAIIAPYKCSVLPLSSNDEFKPLTKKICKILSFTF